MIVPEQILTERLKLRRHGSQDLPAFAAFLANPDATRDMAFTDEQKTPEGAAAMLDYVIASYSTDAPVFSLTIAEPSSDEYLGSCGANPLEKPGEFEVYFTVVGQQQRRGYATEAMAALLEYLWETTDTRRVSAFIVPTNAASKRVVEKLGFLDSGPVDRQAVTGGQEHRRMEGREYVLERSAS